MGIKWCAKLMECGKHWKPETYYPPGYDYRREWNAAVFLLGVGILSSFRFFGALSDMSASLYVLRHGEKVYQEGVKAEPFAQLMQGYWISFAPLFLFLLAMAWYHYFYYYRDTKSIYLMRRLPERDFVFKTCVRGCILWIGGAVVFVIAWYVLFYGIYLLFIPAKYREPASPAGLF